MIHFLVFVAYAAVESRPWSNSPYSGCIIKIVAIITHIATETACIAAVTANEAAITAHIATVTVKIAAESSKMQPFDPTATAY